MFQTRLRIPYRDLDVFVPSVVGSYRGHFGVARFAQLSSFAITNVQAKSPSVHEEAIEGLSESQQHQAARPECEGETVS